MTIAATAVPSVDPAQIRRIQDLDRHDIERAVAASNHDDGVTAQVGRGVEVPGVGAVVGDVAWSGNWFFLIEKHGKELKLANVDELTDYCWRVRQAVNAQGFPEVDHVELFSPIDGVALGSRNFVQCPGKAYDRSPCGTGTSAKLACLAADEKLQPGETWVQEGIIGSRFTGTFQWLDRASGKVAPVITGRAYVNAEATQLLDDQDPFCWGIRS